MLKWAKQPISHCGTTTYVEWPECGQFCLFGALSVLDGPIKKQPLHSYAQRLPIIVSRETSMPCRRLPVVFAHLHLAVDLTTFIKLDASGADFPINNTRGLQL